MPEELTLSEFSLGSILLLVCNERAHAPSTLHRMRLFLTNE